MKTTTDDFRRMTDEEVTAAETRIRGELLQFRFQQHTAQLTNTAQLGAKRRELARLMTVVRERELGMTRGTLRGSADAAEG